MVTKVCTKCLVERPIEEFEKRKQSRDGRRHQCKFCKNEANRISYHSNPDFKNKKKKYHDEHKERKSENQRARYHRNKAKGICTCCGKPNPKGGCYCSPCLKKKNIRGRKYLFENGKCVRCGSKLDLYGIEPMSQKTCPNCSAKLHMKKGIFLNGNENV